VGLVGFGAEDGEAQGALAEEGALGAGGAGRMARGVRLGGRLPGGAWLTGAAFLNMNGLRVYQYAADKLVWLALAAWLVLPLKMMGAAEMKLDVLRTRTIVYTNVTVTTRATNYVFILHSTGMASIKVTELSQEGLEQLGYVKPRSVTITTNTASVWAKRELAKLNVPDMASLKRQVARKWAAQAFAKPRVLGLAGMTLVYAVLGVVVLLYLFHCYCCMLICRKAGSPPGLLIWLPVLQVFPLLRAAGMSAWWFLALLVPVVSLIPSILWPFKIAQARGKSAWVGLLLLLPITNFFTFLYLAFSDGGSAEEEEEPERKIMSLQGI
jgi:Family of unknown function (DUF5684)